MMCIGITSLPVKGLVPLKEHTVAVTAVYKDRIEMKKSVEFEHTGMYNKSYNFIIIIVWWFQISVLLRT